MVKDDSDKVHILNAASNIEERTKTLKFFDSNKKLNCIAFYVSR